MMTAVPDHVPAELVVDFDFYDIPDIGGDPQLTWKAALPDVPIVYTPRNGGHWVFTHAEDIEAAFRNFEQLSNSSIIIPAHESPIKMLPDQSDPPDHGFYRQSVESFFSASAIAARENEIREFAIELIETLKPRGECDFIEEFANQLPIVMFLRIMGLPVEDREPLREAATKMVRGSDAQTKTDGFEGLLNYLAERIAERQISPCDDIISSLLSTNIDGRQMVRNEALGICGDLLLGGLDTVASLLGLIARFLAENPDQRRFIRANPAQMPRIVQELTRRFAIVSTGRVVKRDHDFKGVRLKQGDLVLLPTVLYGMDEMLFACPHAVDFERKMTPNITFGSGIHTCLGNVLARAEIRIFVEEWLARIPEFSRKPDCELVLFSGPVTALQELWLQWPKAFASTRYIPGICKLT